MRAPSRPMGLALACITVVFIPWAEARELVPEPGWTTHVIAQGDGYPGGIAIGNALLPPKPAVNFIYCAKGNGDLVAFWTDPWAPTTWVEEPVKAGAGYEGVFIGPGRDDGNDRLYCIKESGLWELFSADGGSMWTEVLMLQNPAAQWDCIIIGPGRNDGVNRVYATDNQFNVYEFTYNHVLGQWEWVVYNENVRFEAIGPGRNDEVNRVYGVERIGDDELAICELTYQGVGWIKTYRHQWDWGTSTPFIGVVRGVTLAPARGGHDGHLQHIYYQNPYNGINELTWDQGAGIFQNSSVLLNKATDWIYGEGAKQWGGPFSYGKAWHVSYRARCLTF